MTCIFVFAAFAVSRNYNADWCMVTITGEELPDCVPAVGIFNRLIPLQRSSFAVVRPLESDVSFYRYFSIILYLFVSIFYVLLILSDDELANSNRYNFATNTFDMIQKFERSVAGEGIVDASQLDDCILIIII